MGHSIFEITDTNLRFEPERLGALVDAARERGYLEDHDPANTAEGVTPERDALESLLSEFFPCNAELDERLELRDPAFEWYDGASFPFEDLCELFAVAAVPGSWLTFLEIDEGTRDVYDVVFEGDGRYRRVDVVRDGAPIRKRD